MTVKLKDIAWIERGKNYTVVTGDVNTEGQGLPFIAGAGDLKDDKVIVKYYCQRSSQCISQINDIIFSVTGTIGKCLINTQGEFAISIIVCFIRLKEYNKEYNERLLEYLRFIFKYYNSGFPDYIYGYARKFSVYELSEVIIDFSILNKYQARYEELSKNKETISKEQKKIERELDKLFYIKAKDKKLDGILQSDEILYCPPENICKIKKKKTQFYETSPLLAKIMIEMANIQENESVLEPSAGMGAIAKFLPKRAVCIEKDLAFSNFLKGSGFQVVFDDFMEYPLENKFDVIIANPPFLHKNQTGADVVHILKMLLHFKRCIVVIACRTLLERDTMEAKLLRFVLKEKYQVEERILRYKEHLLIDMKKPIVLLKIEKKDSQIETLSYEEAIAKISGFEILF